MEVIVWLRRLGASRYEAAFRENEVDETRHSFTDSIRDG